MKTTHLYINDKRTQGEIDKKLYGHFLEHFHRQIYGGIFDPESPLSNSNGLRKDVIDAMKDMNTSIIRWPGGCFVSSYHWKDGIGKNRTGYFDKAWRVEDPNTYGTDEFIGSCRAIGAEPYICTNAGTGTPQEMSDWVEYCNLENEGVWAKKRIENGHPEPYNVKYWSIGNENYGKWEMGSKTKEEWGRFVIESVKMMKRVDPTIEILAASVPDLDWNINLLREAGDMLDWISIHGYWDALWQENNLSSYEKCMAYTLKIEEPIIRTKHILGALGYLGRIKIAYDEWNLRGWHHPYIHQDSAIDKEDYITPRDKNDINSSYTMADAVFSGCFLNTCIRHCDVVGMANFAPAVNTRGAIFTHEDGIVLRSTYYVFELYSKYMGDTLIDSYMTDNESFDVMMDDTNIHVPSLDVVAAVNSSDNSISIAINNRHPDSPADINIHADALKAYNKYEIYEISADSKDSYNDIDRTDVSVKHITDLELTDDGQLVISVPEHSVSILVLSE